MLNPRQLRERIRNRANRLYESQGAGYQDELKYFLQFLHENQYTRALLSALGADSSVDLDRWVDDVDQWGERQFPNTEVGRAKLCYDFLRRFAKADNLSVQTKLGRSISSKSRFDEILRDIDLRIVKPLVNFIQDKIDDRGNILYLIERFKLKCEWFIRDDLHCIYERDPSKGERNLDRKLRAALFDGGIDYPFSEPVSPSGKVDIVANLESDDPLVLEVKVFDPKQSKGKSRIKQGFHQVLSYVHNYNQSVGYLVIFNCSDKQLVVPSDPPSADYPPQVIHGGKTFFVISIDVAPHGAPASKEKPADRYEISIEELIGT